MRAHLLPFLEHDENVLTEAEHEHALPAKQDGDSPAATDAGGLPIFTLAELQTTLPDGVDHSNKEAHLSDVEFSQLFDMDRAAFSALPTWKSRGLKMKHGLD